MRIRDDLSEDEEVFEYFGSDSLMSFTGETDEEDDAWNEINKHGGKMMKEAAEATDEVKKLLRELVLDNLKNAPMSIHDLTDGMIYGTRRDEVNKISCKEIEKIVFFETLPELGKTGLIKMREMRRLGEGTEYIYYM